MSARRSVPASLRATGPMAPGRLWRKATVRTMFDLERRLSPSGCELSGEDRKTHAGIELLRFWPTRGSPGCGAVERTMYTQVSTIDSFQRPNFPQVL
jgi:hypothetical protein